MNIEVYGKNSEKVLAQCESKVYDLEKLFSAEESDSELYMLNAGTTDKADNELLEILQKSLYYCDKTNGILDISVRPLIELWGFNDKDYYVPTDTEISAVCSHIDYNKIQIKGNTVYLNGTNIDLGAVAKGYTSAKICEILYDNNINNALIDLGGNIRTVGCKPDGALWKIGIMDPDDNNKVIGCVNVRDSAVVTSGAYQRYFEKDGIKYHHIFDSRTGKPANSTIKSVTIVSSDDLLADAYSTAIYIGGIELAQELYKDGNFEYVIVTDDNIITSENIAFELN